MIDVFKKTNFRPRLEGIVIGILATLVLQGGLGYLWDHREEITDLHFTKGYPVIFVTDEIGFLKEGAKVFRNGLKIGVVERLSFAGGQGMVIQAKIFQGNTIPRTSIRTLSETGFGGPRVVNISDVRVLPGHPYFEKSYSPSDTIAVRYETGFYEAALFKSCRMQAKIDSLYSWSEKPEPR